MCVHSVTEDSLLIPWIPQKLEVLIFIITVTFDMNQPMHASMTVPNWNRCAATLFDILVSKQAREGAGPACWCGGVGKARGGAPASSVEEEEQGWP